MENLIRNGLNSIKYSINANDKATYCRIHGRDDFDKVIKNIFDIHNLRKSMNVDVGIFVSFVKCSYNNSAEGMGLRDILKNVVDEFYKVPAGNQGGSMYNEIKNKIIDDNPTKVWARYSGDEIARRRCCPYPFNRISITAEGYLDACCMDTKNELVVADLNKMSLLEAWNCDKMVKLRQFHLDNNIPKNIKCHNCLYNTNYDVKPLCDWAMNS
jgi:hypothetical protein